MTDEFRLEARFRRSPIADASLDVHDTLAVRAWAMEHVTARVRMDGQLRGVLRFLREGVEEHAPTDGLVDLGEEAVLAAFWRSLGQRQGIVRSFREGVLLVRDDEGSLRSAACVMEHVPQGENDHWWLAYRFFGQGEAGVGTFHGDWVEAEGTGMDALRFPFREWLDTGGVQVTRGGQTEQPRDPRDDFDIRMAVLDPLSRDIPTAGDAAVGLGRSMDAEVLGKGLQCQLVFVIKGRVLERWELQGELPCSMDDVIRNLVRIDGADAAVLVTPGTVELEDGQTHRAFFSIGEHKDDNTRVRRIHPLRLRRGAPPEFMDEIIQGMAVAPGSGWFGVEPAVQLGLYALGPNGGGPIAEG